MLEDFRADATEDGMPSPKAPKSGSGKIAPSQWSYLSLSELSVVIKLIRTRSLVDTFYVAQRYANPMSPLSSDGLVDFAEDILTTYIDLDVLISECGLTEKEKFLVTRLMDGYTVRDFTDEGEEFLRQNPETGKLKSGRPFLYAAEVFRTLDEAARKIVTRNNERWMHSQELAHKRRIEKALKEREERRGWIQ